MASKGFKPAQKGNSQSRRAARRAAAQEDPVAAINDVAATAAEQGASSPPPSVDLEKSNGFQRFINNIGSGISGLTNNIGERAGNVAMALNTPQANVIGGAALGAGLSFAGNMMNNEGDEGAGRLLSEAIGAGALGALGMGALGGLNKLNAIANRKNMAISGAASRGRIPTPDELAQERSKNALMGGGTPLNNSLDKYMRGLDRTLVQASNKGAYLDTGAHLGGAAAALGGAVALGGLGGLVGGGLSDLVNATGVPGFGSSNTASAKAGMQSTASTAYPADPTGGMSNEEMYLASLGYLPMS